MGFRDSNQDLLGFVHLVPERARERILDIAATQFPDGSAYHQYQPLTKRGNNEVGSGFNDDPLWLILGVAAYIKETGDFAILDEQVPFDNDPKNAAPLLEHLRRSFRPRARQPRPARPAADWPRRLERLPESQLLLRNARTSRSRPRATAKAAPRNRSSSPACSCCIGPEYAVLLERAGKSDEAADARRHVAERMERAVLEHGWDGEWFLRAYDFFGNKVGSRENDEAQIFIEPQGFCVMAGIGVKRGPRKARARRGQRAARHALRHRAQQSALHALPRRARRDQLLPARLQGKRRHFLPQQSLGHDRRNRRSAAAIARSNTIKKIAPAYLEDISEIHRTEPYVYAQMIAGKDAPRHGEAKNSWLTGTAAWNFVAIAHHLLGIRPEHDGLRVHPCLGKELPEFTVTRRCRGATYRVHVKNRGGNDPAPQSRRPRDRRHGGAVGRRGSDRVDRVRSLSEACLGNAARAPFG